MVEELMDIVIEARREKKAIRFYTVNQSGYIRVFYITSKTKLYKKGSPYPKGFSLEGINDISSMLYPTYTEYPWGKGLDRFNRDNEFLGSYGVGNERVTEHRMFTNKMHATNYSNALKNDPVYVNEVKEWHDYCDRMFGEY